MSCERVVSGQGLLNIYQFLVEHRSMERSEEIVRRMKEEDPSAVIGEAGVRGLDPTCERAVDMFVAAYGAEAGNLSLKVLPSGGLFIAGGIAPRMLTKMKEGFMRTFSAKGRMGRLLYRIPVKIILNPKVALIGARIAASR